MTKKEIKVDAPQEPEMVITGKNIMTGEMVKKPAPAKAPKKDFSEGRTVYTATAAMKGSMGNRKIELIPGEEVHLNEDEYAVFKAYVK